MRSWFHAFVVSLFSPHFTLKSYSPNNIAAWRILSDQMLTSYRCWYFGKRECASRWTIVLIKWSKLSFAIQLLSCHSFDLNLIHPYYLSHNKHILLWACHIDGLPVQWTCRIASPLYFGSLWITRSTVFADLVVVYSAILHEIRQIQRRENWCLSYMSPGAERNKIINLMSF